MTLVVQVSIAFATEPDGYLAYKQKSLGALQAEFVRIVESYGQEPAIMHIQERLTLIDEIARLVVNRIEYRKSQIMENILAGTMDVSGEIKVNQTRESALDACEIYSEYHERFSLGLPVPSVMEKELRHLRKYYDTAIRAACGYVHDHAKMIVAIDNNANREVLELFIVLPFLAVQDRVWSSSEIDSLPKWAREPSVLKAFENLALRIQRPFTAFEFAQYGQSKPMTTAAKIAYFVEQGESLIGQGEQSCGLFCVRAAIMLAEENGSKELAANTRLQLAKWYDKIGHAKMAAATTKEAMEGHKDWSSYGEAAALRLLYLYRAKEFAAIKEEARQYQDNERCKAYLPQIIYISWLAHERLDLSYEAEKLKSLFLGKYSKSPLCADLHYDSAITALLESNTVEALRLLELIEYHYPSSRIMGKVKKLQARLRKAVPTKGAR